MDDPWLDQIQQPVQAERLLEILARHTGLLPAGARRVRKQEALPRALQAVVKRAIAHPWAAFSSGSSFWLFTGTVSVARSRLIKSPVLQVNSYTEDGVLIDAGLWSAGCDGQWHRLDTSEVLRMQDNDR